MYGNASTSIRFILSEPVRIKTSDNYVNDIDDMAEALAMFSTQGTVGVMNIHIVRFSPYNNTGFGVIPSFGSVPNSRWNCYIATLGHDRPFMASSLAHEIGHTLGLLHTHHPGRLILKALNDGENAQVDNNCFQEMRNRDRENKLIDFFSEPEHTMAGHFYWFIFRNTSIHSIEENGVFPGMNSEARFDSIDIIAPYGHEIVSAKSRIQLTLIEAVQFLEWAKTRYCSPSIVPEIDFMIHRVPFNIDNVNRVGMNGFAFVAHEVFIGIRINKAP